MKKKTSIFKNKLENSLQSEQKKAEELKLLTDEIKLSDSSILQNEKNSFQNLTMNDQIKGKETEINFIPQQNIQLQKNMKILEKDNENLKRRILQLEFQNQTNHANELSKNEEMIQVIENFQKVSDDYFQLKNYQDQLNHLNKTQSNEISRLNDTISILKSDIEIKFKENLKFTNLFKNI